MRSLPGVSCVWDDYYDPFGKPKKMMELMPVTSNKMRGPLSDQPKKIGEHVYHTVDHIVRLQGRSLLTGVHACCVADTLTLAFLQFCSEQLEFLHMVNEPLVLGGKEKAILHPLPSYDVPSDHAPVVADFAFLRADDLDDAVSSENCVRSSSIVSGSVQGTAVLGSLGH